MLDDHEPADGPLTLDQLHCAEHLGLDSISKAGYELAKEYRLW